MEGAIIGSPETPGEGMSDLEEEREAVCGDGNCERDKGETYENCPQDCIPEEGAVNPEEERPDGQPAVTEQAPVPPVQTFFVPEVKLACGIIAGFVMFAILAYFLVRRKRGTS